MSLTNDIRFTMRGHNPSRREVGGNDFPPLRALDSETRFGALENAIAALATTLEALARRVEEMQSGSRDG